MPLPALEHGTDWEWETFAEFLDRFEGNIAVNAGFLVGHCAIRRYVMGADAIGNEAHARADRRDARRARPARSRPARSASRSRSRRRTATATASRWRAAGPRPTSSSRCARRPARTPAPRSRASCRAASTSSPTTRSSCSARSSAAANRPLNWNVLTVDAREPDRVPRQLGAGDRAAELGGRLVALTMPVQVPMNMSFLTFCGIWLLPGWQEILGVPVPERIERLRDPDTRALDARAVAVAGGRRVPPSRRLGRLPPRRRVLRRRTSRCAAASSRDIAAERGTVELRHAARHRASPTSCAPCCGRSRRTTTAASWELRRRGVERPARHDRRLRRRRAPRPHVRRALHHPLPRRLPARPPAGVARARGAAHHERAGRAVRAARPRRAARGRDRRRRASSTPRPSAPRTPRSSPTCPATPPASPPAPSAIVRVLVERHRRSSRTARPPARRPASCCAPGATPTPSPPADPCPTRGRRRRPRAGRGLPSCVRAPGPGGRGERLGPQSDRRHGRSGVRGFRSRGRRGRRVVQGGSRLRPRRSAAGRARGTRRRDDVPHRLKRYSTVRARMPKPARSVVTGMSGKPSWRCPWAARSLQSQ